MRSQMTFGYMYFIQYFIYVCLHLYKNTEYSRDFTQSINWVSIIFTFGTQTYFLPRAIWIAHFSGTGWDTRALKHCYGCNSAPSQTSHRPTKEQHFGAVILSTNAWFLMPKHQTHQLFLALTKSGKWETMLFIYVSSQLRTVIAHYIQRLCIKSNFQI